MILVLLSRFSDHQQGIVEFSLCQKLAEQGYQLYVTTTSTGNVLQREIQKAADISSRVKGGVTLLQPQWKEDENPKEEWIVTKHEQYFSFLTEFNNIQAVIGLLPGTEEAAVELKEALDCKLVFLASSIISEEVYQSKQTDLDRVAQIADEIWVFGSHVYQFYHQNLDISLRDKLKELSLQPFLERFIKKRNPTIYDSRTNDVKFISRWKSSHTSFAFRKELLTKGSDIQTFVNLGSALATVNGKTNSNEIQWHIYGEEDELTSDDLTKGQKLDFLPFTTISSHTDISWNDCSAFIAPDVSEADFNFDALAAILHGVPTLVSRQSTTGHFLSQLKCQEKNEALVDLTDNVNNDKQTWAEKIHKVMIDKNSNPFQWAEQINKSIKKSFQAWKTSILVLLHKFNEGPESCLGFQLCQKLVKEGHHLLVSTTASGDELESEIKKAKWLTDNSQGSITLIEPHCGKQEVPSVEWIEQSSTKYFWHLSQLQNVQMIIGNLPGTSQTAATLNETLKCSLILLATAKLGSENNLLKDKICTLAERADEIWSVGSDVYSHYNEIFSERKIGSRDKHREILFQPWTTCNPQNNEDIRKKQKLISSFNKPVQFYLEGKIMSSKGSDMNSFSTVNTALRNVMQSDMMRLRTVKWQWDIYGFLDMYPQFKLVDDLKVTPLIEVASADHIDWENCLAFIVPDHEEETFNFLALTAIWLGIPTLASSQSSIGKFLLSLSCSEASRGVVHLTGNDQQDTVVWTNIINGVLGQDARPTEWARQLTQYLQSNNDLWELNFPKLRNNSKRWLSSSLNSSLFSKKYGQLIRSDVLDEVAKTLERSNTLENNAGSKHSGISSFDSQVCYNNIYTGESNPILTECVVIIQF